MSSFSEKVTTLVRARYPLVWLETYEETRAILLLEKVAREQGKKIAVWSVTSGLNTLDGTPVGENTQDPIGVLTAIQDNKEQMIVVLKDLHKFLPEQDTVVYRKLRDLYDSLKATSKTIFILSPIVKIPAELSKSITVLTLQLPEKEELETTLNGIIEGFEELVKEWMKNATLWKGVEEKIKTIQETIKWDEINWKELQEEVKKKLTLDRIKAQLSYNGTKDAILRAGLGLTLTEYEDVLTKSLVEKHELDISIIISEKEQTIKKSGILEFYSMEKLSEMSEVGGLKSLKLWIQKRKQAYSQKAKAYGLKIPKGILLVGAPGTGKSLIAKVAAKYMQMPLIRLDMSELQSKYYGETNNKVKNALNLAEAVSPCVFWWDEIEKMFGTGTNTHEVTMNVISTILTWMQELDKPVFIIATCNDPQALKPELMRAGRFDEVFYVDLPNPTEREEIFRIHIQKTKRNPIDFRTTEFATITEGYSGAEIETCVQDALNNAFFEDLEITSDHIVKSIKSTIPLSKKRKDELDRLREWGITNAVSANEEEPVEKKRKVGRKIDL